MPLGLRTQLLAVSSLLLALPFLGLRAAREVEAFLVETQEQGLASTARAVAIALNERPGIFQAEPAAGSAGTGVASAPLRIETLRLPVTIDGLTEDWMGQPSVFTEIEAAAAAESSPEASPAPHHPPALPTRTARP
jgi:two-component system sensor histidine kinase ChvG